jgi:NitT/TauT family transport system substrate-binding protein
MKKGIIGLVLFTILAMVLAGCGQNSETSGQTGNDEYVMKIVALPGLCVAPLHVAHEMGFFKQEGLKYDWSVISDPSASGFDLMASGKNDMLYALLPTVIQRAANGMKLKVIMGMHFGCINVVALNKSGINNLTDLKGKKVGVPGLGSDPAVLLQRMLKAKGISTSPENMEVQLVVYPDSSLQMALDKGLVDAVVSWDPVATAIAKRGDGKIIFNQATDPLTQNEYCCVVALDPGFLKNHPETAAKFARAMQKACDYVATHPRETAQMQIDKKYCSFTDIDLNTKLLSSYKFAGRIEQARQSMIKTTKDCIELGIIDKNINVDEFINNNFAAVPGVKEPKN